MCEIHHYFNVFNCLQNKGEQISLPTGKKIEATALGVWSMWYL